MKTLTLSLFLIITCTIAKAQLAGTKWDGTAQIPTATAVTFEFKADTLNMIVTDTKQVVETMTYAVKGDVVTVKKTDGLSPCEVGSTATVKYTIKDNKLTLVVIQDPCDERHDAWPVDAMTKEK